MPSARSRYEHVVEEGSDIRRHLPRLRAAARGTVVELGVRDGNSTTAFLAGIEEHGGGLWSIDVDPHSAEVFAGHEQWHFVHGDSRDVSAAERAGLPGAVDVLFVDTLHTYDQVTEELVAWGGRVRPGGVMLFHDTADPNGVREAVEDYCRPRGIPCEFLPGSHGLGIAFPGAALPKRVAIALRRPLRWAHLRAWSLARAARQRVS